MTIPRLSQSAIKRIRAKLRARNPHCHWCNVLTLEASLHGGLDMETVDHLKPRRECRSAAEYHAESNLVLACYECNRDRDVVDIALLAHQREEQAKMDALRKPTRRNLVRTAC